MLPGKRPVLRAYGSLSSSAWISITVSSASAPGGIRNAALPSKCTSPPSAARISLAASSEVTTSMILIVGFSVYPWPRL